MDTTTRDIAAIDAGIRAVLAEHGRLSIDVHAMDPDADLYQAGMTSHAGVNVLIALENAFDVEFPDALLNRSVFRSLAAIRGALIRLGVGVG